MIKKILTAYNDFSIADARIRVACFIGALCLCMVGYIVGIKSFFEVLVMIIALLLCCVIVTKSYLEKRLFLECSDLVKKYGIKMNGTVVEVKKEINWGGPNTHFFRYSLVVKCNEKKFVVGYFGSVKNLINKKVDLYILDDYVCADIK